MLIVYAFASLLGALATVLLLSPFGWVVALVCAPMGGSAFTLIAALARSAQEAPVGTVPSAA